MVVISALIGGSVAIGLVGAIVVLVVVGGVAIAMAAIASERAGLAILIVAMFFDAINLTVGDLFNIRPAFVVFAIVFPIVAFRWLMSGRPLPYHPVLIPLAVLAALFYFATAINVESPFQARGFVQSTLLVLNIAVLVLVYDQASRDRKGFERILNFALVAGAAFSAIGLLTLILFQLGANVLSPLIEFRSLGDWTVSTASTPVPRPIFLEPNNASYLGAFGIFALGMSLATRGRRAFGYVVLAVLLFTGDTLAYSRGAWLGTLVGGAALAFLAVARPGWANVRPQRIMFVLALTGVTALVVLAVVPSVFDVLLGRGANLLNTQQGTGLGRLADWNMLITDGLNKPILGHGADAYKLLLLPTQVVESASVEIFHSTGIVGLGLYVGANIVVLTTLARAVFGGRPDDTTRATSAIALSSFVALLVSSQLNPSMWGTMYWLLFGIVLAATTSLDESTRSPTSEHQAFTHAVRARAI